MPIRRLTYPLRRWDPDPEEQCRCTAVTEVVLCIQLLPCISCMSCGEEIELERLGLSEAEAADVAYWLHVVTSMYQVWMHTEAKETYESYAMRCLQDPHGQIVREGRRIAKRLSVKLPTLVFLRGDSEATEHEFCPICGAGLDFDGAWSVGRCRPCHIHL